MNDASPTDADCEANAPATAWPDAALLGVAMIWGINIPIMKTGLEQIDVYVFNAIRLAVSASVLVAFAWRERRRGVSPSSPVPWRHLVTYGVMVCTLYQLLFLLGIARTTSGNTALIISTVPIWTALLARVLLGERLRRLAWSGLLIALVGTVIVALQKGDVTAGGKHLAGNLIVLSAAMMWAGGTVYSRPLLRRISPMQLSAVGAVIGWPAHLLIAAFMFDGDLAPLRSTSLWLIILYAGVLSSGLALPMWSYGVRHAGAAHAAVIQNLIPLVAIFVAWITRGESATGPQLLGGAMILTGLVVMRRGRE